MHTPATHLCRKTRTTFDHSCTIMRLDHVTSMTENRSRTIWLHPFATIRTIWNWSVMIVWSIFLIATSVLLPVNKHRLLFMSIKMALMNKMWVSFWTLYNQQERTTKFQDQVTAIGNCIGTLKMKTRQRLPFLLMVHGCWATIANKSKRWCSSPKKLRKGEVNSKNHGNRKMNLHRFTTVTLSIPLIKLEDWQIE